MWSSFSYYYIPSPNPQINSADRWGNYDETYDEIMMKLWWNWGENCFKICLACITGYWDPEFEPGVKEIVDYRWYMAILSDSFLWRACIHGGGSLFSLAHGSGGHVWINWLKPHAPIYAYMEHAQFELWWRTVAWCNTFHEGQGM